MYRQQEITAKPTSLVKETPSRPPMQVLIDIASEIAADLTERVETEMLQEWQVIFRLAKRLQSIPGIGKYDVTKLYPVLENFCDALTECGGEHVDFSEDSREERWLELIDVRHKVRFPMGQVLSNLLSHGPKKSRLSLLVGSDKSTAPGWYNS